MGLLLLAQLLLDALGVLEQHEHLQHRCGEIWGDMGRCRRDIGEIKGGTGEICTSTSPSVAPMSAQVVMGSTWSTQLDTCWQPRRSLSSSIVGPSMRCCLATRLALSAASASPSLAKAAASASTGALSW